MYWQLILILALAVDVSNSGGFWEFVNGRADGPEYNIPPESNITKSSNRSMTDAGKQNETHQKENPEPVIPPFSKQPIQTTPSSISTSDPLRASGTSSTASVAVTESSNGSDGTTENHASAGLSTTQSSPFLNLAQLLFITLAVAAFILFVTLNIIGCRNARKSRSSSIPI